MTPASDPPTHLDDPPKLISIGSFLIDEFDTPPRPNTDSGTIPSPALSSSSSRPFITRDRPTSPRQTLSRPQSPFPGVDAHGCPRPGAYETASTTSTGSGASTPQLPFDEATPPPDKPFEYLGGGALYAIIGARVFLPARDLKTLVDVAEGKADLRPDLLEQAESFGDMWVWNESPTTRMTRSRIRYHGDTRLYHPTLRPPHRTLADLIGTPLQGGLYLHVAPPFSAEHVWALQQELVSLTVDDGAAAWRPKLVFEPTPPSCHAGQRLWLEKVAPGLHVLSPNHEELLSFYGHPRLSVQDPQLRPTIQSIVEHLIHEVGVGVNGSGIVAVRSGRLGCCIGTKETGVKWFPAYYSSQDENKVRDVTGAGNAFIGGFVAGLSLTNGNANEAAVYGTVAASYVVEQVGLPTITWHSGHEVWNAEPSADRLARLRARWVEAGYL